MATLLSLSFYIPDNAWAVTATKTIKDQGSNLSFASISAATKWLGFSDNNKQNNRKHKHCNLLGVGCMGMVGEKEACVYAHASCSNTARPIQICFLLDCMSHLCSFVCTIKV